MEKLTFGSLFSGIGGIDLGLERAGFQVAWQVEIDEYCTKVLSKHWPNVTRYGDIRTVGSHNLPAVDLLAGGFPCQPHSLAGKRQASGDNRDLWGEFYRVICELKPRYVLAENVPGLLSSEDGRFFGRVLRDLAACGYDAEWQVLSAASVGAPHLRERVFIAAYSIGTGTRMEIHRGGRQGRQSPITPQSAILRQEDRTGSAEGIDASCQYVADAYSERLERPELFRERDGIKQWASNKSWWTVEPAICRISHGVPARMDRLRGLGNAVVPQVAEYVGECILASLESEVCA